MGGVRCKFGSNSCQRANVTMHQDYGLTKYRLKCDPFGMKHSITASASEGRISAAGVQRSEKSNSVAPTASDGNAPSSNSPKPTINNLEKSSFIARLYSV